MEEELERQEIINIEYNHPKFWHRVMANLVDILIFAATAVLLFIGFRAFFMSLPDYKEKENYVNETRLSSGLYVQDDKRIISLTTYLEENKNFAPSVKNLKSQEAINEFIAYIDTNFGSEKSAMVQTNYDEFRLADSLKYEGQPYFIKDGDKIKYNPDCEAVAKDYYNNVYYIYLSENCESYLFSINIQYAQATKGISNYLLWLEIPLSYVLGAILTYFVPPLFFKRGRQTLGKALYHIGTVDERLFSPTFARFSAWFAIFLGAELILSLATFGIPFIISFSLMAFSKRHQGFPNYMLGLTEIDVSHNRIYFDKVDVELTQNPPHKDPVDFNLINKE